MPEALRLRPHHLICLRFFDVNERHNHFAKNVRGIIDRMNDGGSPRIMLTARCDDICRVCPNNENDRCRYETSAFGKDASVVKFLGIPPEGEVSTDELMASVTEAIRGISDIRDVCGACSMSPTCNRQLMVRRGQSSPVIGNAQGPSDVKKP